MLSVKCKECGHKFYSKSKIQIYCDRKCKNRAQKRKERENRKKLPKIRCKLCDELFTPITKLNVLCSDECRKLNDNIKKSESRERKRKAKLKYCPPPPKKQSKKKEEIVLSEREQVIFERLKEQRLSERRKLCGETKQS